jgi:hypothetical protein
MSRRRSRLAACAVSTLAVVGGASLASLSPNEARAEEVREIAAPWLADIALAKMGPLGPLILVNPQRCAEVGPAVCAFSRMHELGHVALRHFAPAFAASFSGRQLAEIEADCFAARNASYREFRAAIEWFLSPAQVKADDGYHGTGAERAARIRKCRGG